MENWAEKIFRLGGFPQGTPPLEHPLKDAGPSENERTTPFRARKDVACRPPSESHCATCRPATARIAQCDTSSARPPRRGSEGSATPPSCAVGIDAVDGSAVQQELQCLGEAVALALGQPERAGRGIGDKSGSFFGGFVHFLIMEKFSTEQPSSISIQGGCSSCCTLPTSSRNRASCDSACSSRAIRSVNPLSPSTGLSELSMRAPLLPGSDITNTFARWTESDSRKAFWEPDFFHREHQHLASSFRFLLMLEPVVLDSAVIFPTPILLRDEPNATAGGQDCRGRLHQTRDPP